jgi:hypothetical protein
MEALLGQLVATLAGGQQLFGFWPAGAARGPRGAAPLMQAITQQLLQAAVELVEALGLLLQPALGILMIEPLLQRKAGGQRSGGGSWRR